jgi:hypothetical protein
LAEWIPFDDVKVPFADGGGNSRSVDAIGIAFPKGNHGEVLIHGVFRIHALQEMRILLALVRGLVLFWEAKYSAANVSFSESPNRIDD